MGETNKSESLNEAERDGGRLNSNREREIEIERDRARQRCREIGRKKARQISDTQLYTYISTWNTDK